MSRCLVVQHAVAESPYAIGEALCGAEVEFDVCRVFADEPVPDDAASFDGLVVMGGPMSARSEIGFASRRAELALVADALRRGIPILGVCLGAQLLAAACGAAVRASRTGPEIGWAPVDLLETCDDDALFAELPRQLTVLHWHGETFDLPVGATRLMSNAEYPNQAFRASERAWGLQFHLEVSAEAVAAFIDAFPEEAELAPGGAAALRASTDVAVKELKGARDIVLKRFAALITDAAGIRELTKHD